MINVISAHAHKNGQHLAKMYSNWRVTSLLQVIGATEANDEVRFSTRSSQVAVSARAQWNDAKNSLIM